MKQYKYKIFNLVAVVLTVLFCVNYSAADPIPQTDWALWYVDSEELDSEDGAAVNAFDGDIHTIWHTEWSSGSPPPPHEIQIDLGLSYEIDGFRYLPRQDGGRNGRIGQYEFYVSTDGFIWAEPVVTGIFADDATEKEVVFAPATGRFIRLRALTEVGGGPWTSMAEINILGNLSTGNQAPNGVIDSPSGDLTVDVGGWVDFAGTGSDPDGDLPLTFLWQFGTGSGIADSTEEDPGLVQFNNPGTYTATFTVTDALGLSDPTPATCTITVSNTTIIPQTDWTIWYVDSEEVVREGHLAINAFDGDIDTMWHTQWVPYSPLPPHEIQIDLGLSYEIDGFRYLPRQDGGRNGRIGQYEFYVSTDGFIWAEPVVTGIFADDATEKEVVFAPATGRFIRLRALTEVRDNPWTSMAEINVLGNLSTGNQAPNGAIDSPSGDLTVDVGGWVDFAGTGSDPDNNFPLSFLWEFGTGSGIADSTEEDPGLVQFNNLGIYTATFTVTDALGLSDPTPATCNITVQSSGNQAPNGAIDSPSGDLTVDVGGWVDFAGTGSDPDNNFPLSFLWEFGTGSGIADSTEEDPGLVQFNNLGIYTATFTVTDALGLSDPTPATCNITVQTGSSGELIPDWTSVEHSPLDATDPAGITNPVLTAMDVTDAAASFVADPFIFHENDIWHMFFEVYIPSIGHGNIGFATSADGLHWNYEAIVLSDGMHHSYPLVLKYNGTYYMIPESYQQREVRVYEASDFPYNWTYTSTIISGKQFVDPSIFRYNDKWWMFVGETTNSYCYLYYSDDLLTGWVEHPMSPVVDGDASMARPGGRSFVFDNNRIIRIAQKCDIRYGQRVRAFEVDVLSETQYAEHEIPESPILYESGTGWNASGMHHFDPWWTGQHWLCAVDGQYSGNWSIGIYIREHPSAPNGVIDSPSGDLTVDVGGWVDFAGTGSDPDGDLPLTFLWQFGTGSGIADSTEEDPGLVQFNNPGTYTATFTVTDALGLSDPTPATCTITVSNTTIIPQTDWALWYVDSEELDSEDGAAVNAFDGDIDTMWHTQWVPYSPPLPHEIQIDLGLSYEIDGFRYLPRQDGGRNGRIGQYEFYVSTDGFIWAEPVVTGIFADDATEKEVVFVPATGRFIRLRALTEVRDNPWTSMAEINILGNLSTGNQAPNGAIDSPSGDLTVDVGGWVDFAGTGSDPDGDLPLTFLWQFGTGSGIADSTEEDPGLVQFNNPGTYTATFTVTDALGLSDPTPATCTITVSNTTIIPQTDWALWYVDSEELDSEDGAAVNAFDGDIHTIWHTEWSSGSPPPPHEIQIDLGLSYEIDGFRYLPRQDGGRNGRIGQYEFYVSTDGFIWAEPVVTGIFADDATEKEVVFAPATGRFIRLRALTEVRDNPWTSMAEINVLGNP